MQSVWDWITLIGFAGLVTLFLQRSSQDEPQDKLWQYAPPSIGCAVANYLGNEGYAVAAVVVLVAAAYFVYRVLKPRIVL